MTTGEEKMRGKTALIAVGGLIAGVILTSWLRPGLATPTGTFGSQAPQAPGTGLELQEPVSPRTSNRPLGNQGALGRPRLQQVARHNRSLPTVQPGFGAENWGGIEMETVSGAVTGATRAPMGELDGFVLGSGIVVKFPPHIGYALEGLVGEGQSISATGWQTVTPFGERHFHAATLTLPSGEELQVGGPGLAPLPPPGARYAPHKSAAPRRAFRRASTPGVPDGPPPFRFTRQERPTGASGSANGSRPDIRIVGEPRNLRRSGTSRREPASK